MTNGFRLINLATVFALAVGSASSSSSSSSLSSTEERRTLRGGQDVVVKQPKVIRDLKNCKDDEKVFRLDLTTNDSGKSTSYTIEQYENGSWEEYLEETDHDENQGYTKSICVAPGSYRFIMSGSGDACYTAYLMGNVMDDVSGCGDKTINFTLGDSQIPVPSPTPPANPDPTPTPPTPPPVDLEEVISARISSCASNEHLVTFEIQLDAFGEETSWTLKDSQGTTLLSNSRTYVPDEYDVMDICLSPASNYVLTVRDPYDGLCCDSRDTDCPNWRVDKNCVGWYKMMVDGVEVVRGGEYILVSKQHEFNLVPHTMTERDQEWLDSHNTRRKTWHEQYGKSYVPLKWSNTLKASAQDWAEQLLKTCGQSLYHDPNNSRYGENLASNFGTGSYAALTSASNVLGRFVEWEQDWEWPRNAHLTQVLWRGSQHVGCTDAATTVNGQVCHVQVCRYARAGNCDLSKFNDGSNKWWMNAVMQDESSCGDACPSEGCHYY